MELNSQNIGSFIKLMRQKAGMTQMELAGRIGVGNKTVSKWEQGRGIPDISLLHSLSLELDVDIESLLAGNLDDIGKRWIGIVYFLNIEKEWALGKKEWEYILSMFLLVGIREIAILCTGKNMEEMHEIFNAYLGKGYFRKLWCVDSVSELRKIVKLEEKHISLLYQPAFLYGMNLTKYMQNAMLEGKVSILSLRQGRDSFMPRVCFDNYFSCINLQKNVENDWHMFPMLFGQGRKMIVFLEKMEENSYICIDTDILLKHFSAIHVEPMGRGMLAFSFGTKENRELSKRILSGIEESQDIKIGDFEEIMHIRGWDRS